MMGWIFSVGRILGFGVAGGVRPSLTLAIIGAMARIGIGPPVVWPFGFLDHWITILILAVLAIFESKFDSVPALARMQDRLLLPWRTIAGAVAAAATIGHGTLGLVLGLLLGAVAAFMGQAAKYGGRPSGGAPGLAFALISLSKDLFAFGGAVATALYGLLGYVFFGLNMWLVVWLRVRRRQKYRRLRPTADRQRGP
jgi:hypothetical protein